MKVTEKNLFTKLLVAYNNLTHYSTAEKHVGWWIDGEPIYRRCYIFDYGTTSGAKAYNEPSGITNLKRITRIEGRLYIPTEYAYIEPYYWNTSDYFRLFYINETNPIRIRTNKTAAVAVYVVIEYMKNT